MNPKTIYLIDANTLIDAYQRYYSFDIAPSFWRSLKQCATIGDVVSIDKIKQEINNYNDDDELKAWVNSEFDHCFLSTADQKVFDSYSAVMAWAANSTHFIAAAKSEFAGVADGWLVACAKAYNFVLVTQEKYDANIKRKIKIPNACEAFGVPYINTFEMMRRLRVQI